MCEEAIRGFVVVVVGGISVAGTGGWMCVLHCSEEVHSFDSSLPMS